MIRIIIPILILITSYYLYKKNKQSVYNGTQAWVIDIIAIVAGFTMIILYYKDMFLFLVGSVISFMHLSKITIKIKKYLNVGNKR